MNTCELPYVRQLIPKDVTRDERARIYRGSRKVSLDPIKAADLQYQPVLLQSSMERDMDNIKRAPLYIIPSTTTRVGALTRPAPPQAK